MLLNLDIMGLLIGYTRKPNQYDFYLQIIMLCLQTVNTRVALLEWDLVGMLILL